MKYILIGILMCKFGHMTHLDNWLKKEIVKTSILGKIVGKREVRPLNGSINVIKLARYDIEEFT